MKTASTPYRRAPLAAGISLALAAGAVQADTFNVTTNADSGAGSLREAITSANAAAGPHTIDMSGISGDTVTLASGLPEITEEVDIQGSDVTLDGAGAYTCLYGTGDYAYDLSVSDLTVTNCTGVGLEGSDGIFYAGGGIYLAGANLTLNNTTVTGNSTEQAGGVQIGSGALYMYNSSIDGNSADLGGGLVSIGSTLVIENSSISDNSATGYFGALYAYADYGYFGETITITGSTLSGNSAGAYYGGPMLSVYNSSSGDPDQGVTLSNTTISGNSATAIAGLQILNTGFLGSTYGELNPQLTGATITGNDATGGPGGGFVMANYGGTYYGYAAAPAINNSIIQGNSATTGSADMETDELLIAFRQSAGSGFHRYAAENPGRFQHWVQMRADKLGIDGNVNLNQVSDFFASRVPGGAPEGGLVDVTFNTNFSVVGEAPTTGTFNPDTATSDNLGSDPLLGGLANNGGPTLTHLPGDGSSAIDLIPDGTNGCGGTFSVDQRGEARPEAGGSACDAGSVEAGEGGGGGPGIPEATAVPTLSAWTTGLLALGLALMGFAGLRRRRTDA